MSNELEYHLREYLAGLKGEPDGYVLLSKIYYDLRRMLGDED